MLEVSDKIENQMRPLFSVIIPTYNRSKELKRCLNSLLEQTYKNFEVIVCDDGSTDDSKEVAESFKEKIDIKYIWEVNWGGPARPRNNGIKNASAEWICFLDSDDWWYPKKLEVCLNYISEYDVIYHNLHRQSADKHFILRKERCRQLKSPVLHDLLIKWNALPNSSVCVKKEFLMRVGCFAENSKLIAVEDFDCWLNISKITEKFKYIPICLGAYWSANDSISISSETNIDRLKYLYSKHLPPLSTNKQRKVDAILHYQIGRAYYRMKNFESSKVYLKSAFTKNNYKVKSRAFLFYIISSIKAIYSNTGT